jgi:hypothetical protein
VARRHPRVVKTGPRCCAGIVTVPCLHNPMKARHDTEQRPNFDEFTQVAAFFRAFERTASEENGPFRPAGAERDY